jgi:small-conductance mechanosensitive channel
LGDVVDIEGVRGVVTDIGSRCCQVRRMDGVDMLIPNSSFLQETVTNWTLADHRARFSVSVGAGYGSSTREVAALLLRVVKEHPDVLEDPAPQVLFESFGDSALTFTAEFWLDMARSGARSAESDIRHRIDEIFREHGIAIPFAQHDVHLDSAAPLQVEVAVRSVTRAAKPPAGAHRGADSEVVADGGTPGSIGPWSTVAGPS